MSVVHPPVLWAQRSNVSEIEKNVIFLTIEVQDAENTKIDLKEDGLGFTATSPDKTVKYELNLDFYEKINPDKSQWHETGNHISFLLQKKEAKEEYWPRLLKEKLKLHYIKTDFDKWVDEDEQDAQTEAEDPANMMNFGGAGNPGGAGDIDFSQLLGAAGGGAAGDGPGNYDLSALASQLGQADPSANLSGADGGSEEEDEESSTK